MRKLFFIFLLLPHLLLAEEAIPKFDTKSVLDGVNAKGAMQLVYLGYTRGVADAIVATNTFNNAETGQSLFCMPDDQMLSADLLVSLISSDINSTTNSGLREMYYEHTFPVSAVAALMNFFPCK